MTKAFILRLETLTLSESDEDSESRDKLMPDPTDEGLELDEPGSEDGGIYEGFDTLLLLTLLILISL